LAEGTDSFDSKGRSRTDSFSRKEKGTDVVEWVNQEQILLEEMAEGTDSSGSIGSKITNGSEDRGADSYESSCRGTDSFRRGSRNGFLK
jgi:hypothetical protein